MFNEILCFRFCLVLSLFAISARATETENLGMRALPAPGKVEIDGKTADWDLTGGIFVCGDVESARTQNAVWVHLMYDADNLYVLARWIDSTPMNNPGVVAGDMGFAGDCLQFRTITDPQTASERGAHFTCWRGRDGKDAIDIAYGIKFDGGNIPDAKTKGAQQAFLLNPDGKGYAQELSIPWKLLTKDGQPVKAGATMITTFEPNFTVGRSGRITYKDNFKPNMTLDRVFTFMNSPEWGKATLVTKGGVAPQSLRLSDAREFSVTMKDGVPEIDWTGLIKSRELPGFKPVAIEAPTDGYVSLLIKDRSGAVVRELLDSEFVSKGAHTFKWDGLSTPNWRDPGEPVAVGDYTCSALFHTGIGLRLNGWACNGGTAPWDSADGKGNWGGDHGLPTAAVSDGQHVYLGWNAAEAGRSLLACDLDGHVQWSLTHGGIAGATPIAIDAATHTLYAVNSVGRDTLFRVDSNTGIYSTWSGSATTDLPLKTILGTVTEGGKNHFSMAVVAGKLILASRADDVVAVVDAASGTLLKRFTVKAPIAVAAGPDKQLLIVSGDAVLITDLSAEPKEFILHLPGASAITSGPDGTIYVGTTDPDNQVKLFAPKGEPAGVIGKQGGRALTGLWTPDGMRAIHDLAVDGKGQLWVAEADGLPKRVSVWDTKTKSFIREYFGSTGYGALGGAIDPLDPTIMVGQGCEWKIDPATGRAACVGVIRREEMSVSRFRVGTNGKLYLLVASAWAFNRCPLKIYERIGPADYRLRSEIFYVDAKGNELASDKIKPAETRVWCDEDGSGIRKPGAFSSSAQGEMRFSGWYMDVTSDLGLRSENRRFPVTGYTTAGAPRYNLAEPVKLPAAGFVSADGRFCLQNGNYGGSHEWMTCYDIASGQALWKYPDTFVGVHGSHNAPPGERGLIRGSYNACDSLQLPAPIGNVWIIPTNVGEWHVLTEQGFYLTALFQEDPLKVRFPDAAIPGAVMDNAPPGMGGEDFGGSATLGKDGQVYLQAGKTAFWNLKVVGLDTVKPLTVASVQITADDVKHAQAMREAQLQKKAAALSMAIHHFTPGDFTGDLRKDFKDPKMTEFQKQPDAAVKTTLAYDDANLYVAWEVADNTPWINGATSAEMMYIGGDTVDLQLGTDPAADRNRSEAGAGDLRLSIGNFGGAPKAMLYRRVSSEKKPHTFSSGVVKDYEMQYVAAVDDAKIRVAKRAKGYVVEAAIPLATLGIKPAVGLTIRGDIGATHGDPAGQRTRLRTYWSNQHTGIVDDVVFELQMEPKNWGPLAFE